jgi:hypothetical protein
VPEAQIYNQMHELEKKLDATITRKILDLQDSLTKAPVMLCRNYFKGNMKTDALDINSL